VQDADAHFPWLPTLRDTKTPRTVRAAERRSGLPMDEKNAAVARQDGVLLFEPAVWVKPEK